MKNFKYCILIIISFSIWITSTSFLADAKNDLVTDNSILENDLHDLEFESIDGKIISLSNFKGKYVLIINTASDADIQGNTKTYKKYMKIIMMMIVIGFPCNDFGSQEKGTNQDILSFCQKTMV